MSLTTRIAAIVTAIALVTAGADASMATAASGVAVAAAASAAVTGEAFPLIKGELNSVTAVSASDAWAVGYAGVYDQDAKTLIVHWNGHAWSRVPTPQPVSGTLWDVTATSADNAWAVGTASASDGAHPRPLVMHWDGRTWSRQAGIPAVAGGLNAVTVSGGSVWAAGGTTGKSYIAGESYYAGPSLILHRTGDRWYVVPTTTPAHSGIYGVILTRNGTLWAAGQTGAHIAAAPFLLRWTGALWKAATSPWQKAPNSFTGTAANPGGSTAWAVGYSASNATLYSAPVSMRWNGVSWRNVPVPAPSDSTLNGVGVIPGGTAWAVGGVAGGARPAHADFAPNTTLIMRWTGRAWSRVSSPNYGEGTTLNGVVATSAGSAWAVGSYSPLTSGTAVPAILVAHWNGKTWS